MGLEYLTVPESKAQTEHSTHIDGAHQRNPRVKELLVAKAGQLSRATLWHQVIIQRVN